LGNGIKAEAFAPFLEAEDRLLVPSIVIYEVHKKLLRTSNDQALKLFMSRALRATQIPLDSTMAVAASEISVAHRLAMADAIVYASAQACGAALITADTDFKGLPRVIIP
jgi:predicted nucleic acid-binding protein